MKQKNRASELRAEIKRVKRIIQTTESPYLCRDMTKYLKRLERELRYGNAKESRAQLYD